MSAVDLIIELASRIKQLESDYELLKWKFEKLAEENKQLKEKNND